MYILTECGRLGVYIIIYVVIPVSVSDWTVFWTSFGRDKIYCNNFGLYFFVSPEKIVLFRIH